ncbi:MAG: prepilin-type N-terminal cleavage/methylation domain-containing protein, partial [Gammaproteobacteria bacterium]|nr:prepilin-type N-terminal cleavage/methylation domain-containing protein [Gammaproteobacteria bacterium]
MYQLQTFKKSQSGFTLIEIAIVLVIIGLLLGGVLKGQEMINNSKVKRAVNDFNGVSAAAYSYLDRYSAFPGDDIGAFARWGVTAGNSNGVIGANSCDNVGANEESYFWVHLRNSGLVSGETTDTDTTGRARPRNAFGGMLCVENIAYRIGGPVICINQVDGKFAEIIDRQMDDGIATSGSVQGSTAIPGNAVDGIAYAQGTVGWVCAQ